MRKKKLFILMTITMGLIFLSRVIFDVMFMSFVDGTIDFNTWRMSWILWDMSSIAFSSVVLIYFIKRNISMGKIAIIFVLVREVLQLMQSLFNSEILSVIVYGNIISILASLAWLYIYYLIYKDNQSNKISVLLIVSALLGLALTIGQTLSLTFDLPKFVWYIDYLIFMLTFILCGVNIDEAREDEIIEIDDKRQNINYCRRCGSETNGDSNLCTSCGFNYLNGEAFCQSCGIETKPGQELCISCGFRLASLEKQSSYNLSTGSNEASLGFGILGFFIPLVGLILYLLLKDTEAAKATSAGKGALIGLITGFVLSVIYYSIFIASLTSYY